MFAAITVVGSINSSVNNASSVRLKAPALATAKIYMLLAAVLPMCLNAAYLPQHGRCIATKQGVVPLGV